MKKLFTERHGEAKPRVAEALDDATRDGLLTLVAARIDEEWFGLTFPNKCSAATRTPAPIFRNSNRR